MSTTVMTKLECHCLTTKSGLGTKVAVVGCNSFLGKRTGTVLGVSVHDVEISVICRYAKYINFLKEL